MTAVRTRVVLCQPRLHTIEVEKVMTRQLYCLFTDFKVHNADGTLSCSAIAKVFTADGTTGKGGDGLLWRCGRGISASVLFHELGHDAVEGGRIGDVVAAVHVGVHAEDGAEHC